MSGQFFYLETLEALAPNKIVISVNHRGLALLMAGLWSLLNGEKTNFQLTDLDDFGGINLREISIAHAAFSTINFNGEHLEIAVGQAHLRQYASLLEELLRQGSGHHYLEADSMNADLDIVVSIGEYSPAFIERIARGASRGH